MDIIIIIFTTTASCGGVLLALLAGCLGAAILMFCGVDIPQDVIMTWMPRLLIPAVGINGLLLLLLSKGTSFLAKLGSLLLSLMAVFLIWWNVYPTPGLADWLNSILTPRPEMGLVFTFSPLLAFSLVAALFVLVSRSNADSSLLINSSVLYCLTFWVMAAVTYIAAAEIGLGAIFHTLVVLLAAAVFGPLLFVVSTFPMLLAHRITR